MRGGVPALQLLRQLRPANTPHALWGVAPYVVRPDARDLGPRLHDSLNEPTLTILTISGAVACGWGGEAAPRRAAAASVRRSKPHTARPPEDSARRHPVCSVAFPFKVISSALSPGHTQHKTGAGTGGAKQLSF